MGGDGGVIANNRRYLRGAGAGDKTGDAGADNKTAATIDPNITKQERARAMMFCFISNQPLRSSGSSAGTTIVVCPYGRLYIKEALVEALLDRKKTQDPRLEHIRGLKDLYEVRFHRSSEERGFPTCPIRGTELNGQIPAIVLVPGTPNVVNVVSERALKEMGEDVILEEYGPAEKKIKLLPDGDEMEAIEEQCASAVAAGKKKKNNDKKRKRSETRNVGCGDEEKDCGPKGKAAIKYPNIAAATGSVASKSKVFDSLFTKPAEVSDRETAENLFVRIG